MKQHSCLFYVLLDQTKPIHHKYNLKRETISTLLFCAHLGVVLKLSNKNGGFFSLVLCQVREVFPNLFELTKHLLKKLNKSSQILKNIPAFRPKFDFLGEHLMKSWGTLVVPSKGQRH